jgi:hypothetical protein
MLEDKENPIQECTWGRYIILGVEHSQDGNGAGKDIFVYGTRVTAWDERKGHRLDTRMVDRALRETPDILIIGSGHRGALAVPGNVIQEIKKKVGEVYVLDTPEACRLYNQLYHQGKKVILLAHGTC